VYVAFVPSRLKKEVRDLADRKIPSIGELLANGLTTSKQTKDIFDWEVIESGDTEDGMSLYETLIERVLSICRSSSTGVNTQACTHCATLLSHHL